MGVRRANDHDLGEIIRIWKTQIKTAITPEDIIWLYLRFRPYFLVYEGQGKILGFLAGTIKSPIRGHISGIAVIPEFRRRGIATALIREFELILARDGYKQLSLEVRRSNIAAIKLYEKLGFVRTGIVPGYYYDGEDALNYEKLVVGLE